MEKTSIYLLWLTLCLLGSCAQASLQSRQVEPNPNQVPSVENFYRRALMSIAIIGDYLYIDGGEVSSKQGDTHDSTEVNVTLSIPINTSWTNESVVFNSIPKGGSPYLKQQALFVNENTSTMFAWGGEGGYGNTTDADNRRLWAFTANNSGGGTWDIQRPANPSVFDTFWRSANAAHAVCHGVGFYLNGYASYTTDIKNNGSDNTPVPGLLTYDLTTSTWANESSVNALGYVTWGGTGTCLPDIGSKGTLMFLGGQKAIPPNSGAEWDWVYLSNITLYDPAAKKWYWQETSGETPPPRVNFCSVGVSGTNGTFEIFIFGGASKASVYGDIWILSIPGFHWFKVEGQVSPRQLHACTVIGKRQMLSLGGYPPGGWRDPDPWKQGIGILDLPTLTWTTGYDAGADRYDTPQVVQDWYKQGGVAQWSSKDVATLFGSNSTQKDEPEKKSQSKPPVGAIVGGVIGGIALIGAVLAILFFLRRRQQPKQSSRTPGQDWNKPELPGSSVREPDAPYQQTHEVGGPRQLFEMEANERNMRDQPLMQLNNWDNR